MTAIVRVTGAWSWSEAQDFLEKSKIPIRIAAISKSGWPVVSSMWFVADRTEIWCATQASSSIAQYFDANDRCGFEVAADQPPYRGVHGQAHVTLHRDRCREILSVLLNRYLGGRGSNLGNWLLSRADDEVALRLQPFRCQTWDYTERMLR